jgi:hypothetical protein
LAAKLAAEWLTEFPDLRASSESELIDPIADAGQYDLLREFAARRLQADLDPERRSLWLAVQFLVAFAEFESSAPQEIDRKLIWHLRHRLGGDRHEGRAVPVTKPNQLAWAVRQFRVLWPMATRPSGVTAGNQNEWDGADFLQALINRLASDTSDDAGEELARLNEHEDREQRSSGSGLRNNRSGFPKKDGGTCSQHLRSSERPHAVYRSLVRFWLPMAGAFSVERGFQRVPECLVIRAMDVVVSKLILNRRYSAIWSVRIESQIDTLQKNNLEKGLKPLPALL